MATRVQQSQRYISILHSIVESYIESGEPVASRTIARLGGGRLSPATIRGVMADLVDEGFLAQPHTSAGRIPTLKAFRSYVESLPARRLGATEVQRVHSELKRADSMEERLERSSHLLTEMTRNVGIAAAIPHQSQSLAQVELLLLADRRVLMIVETRDHIVRNRVVALDQEVAQDELNQIRNYLNQTFAGWPLSNIRRELQSRLAEERTAFNAMFRNLELLYRKGLLDLGLRPEIHLDGAANLVSAELQMDRERLQEIFRTLEQKQRLLELLERFLDPSSGDIGIQIGLEAIHPSLHDLSLIGITVTLPTGLSTRVAVLGPIRMNYGQVASAVYHVGDAIQRLSE